MHPPLDRPHPDCQAEIDSLLACHKNFPFTKFMGACNELKTNLDACFKMEKRRMRKANFRKAQAFKEKMKGMKEQVVEKVAPKAEL